MIIPNEKRSIIVVNILSKVRNDLESPSVQQPFSHYIVIRIVVATLIQASKESAYSDKPE